MGTRQARSHIENHHVYVYVYVYVMYIYMHICIACISESLFQKHVKLQVVFRSITPVTEHVFGCWLYEWCFSEGQYQLYRKCVFKNWYTEK